MQLSKAKANQKIPTSHYNISNRLKNHYASMEGGRHKSKEGKYLKKKSLEAQSSPLANIANTPIKKTEARLNRATMN